MRSIDRSRGGIDRSRCRTRSRSRAVDRESRTRRHTHDATQRVRVVVVAIVDDSIGGAYIGAREQRRGEGERSDAGRVDGAGGRVSRSRGWMGGGAQDDWSVARRTVKAADDASMRAWVCARARMVDETVYGCVRARWIGVGAHGCDGGGVGRARGARDAFQTRADGGARDVIERARAREACGRVCE